MSRQYYELKIESGISGGAMSLFNGKKLIDQWTDKVQTGKSDLLLESISTLLDRNKIDAASIKRIVLAENIRSQTAHKIAVSTLKGISVVYGTEIVFTDLFEAISDYFAETVSGKFLVILQIDLDRFEFAFFNGQREKIDSGKIGLDDLKEKIEIISQNEKISLLTSAKFDDSIFERYIKELKAKGIESIEIEENLSKYL